MRNTLLLTAAELALRSVSLIFHAYLSRTIGAVGMGKLQLVATATAFAMTFGLSGARVAAINLTAEQAGKGDLPGMKKSILSCLCYGAILSSLVGILLFNAAPVIAARWIGDSRVESALRIAAAALPFNCLTAILSGYFTARGKIKQLVVIEVFDRLSSVGITTLLLRLWAGSDLTRICCSVVGGGAICTLISFLLLCVRLRRDLAQIQSQTSRRILPKLLSLCIPLALGDYLRSGLSSFEQFLIPHRLRGNYETALGSYGTICAMVFPVLMFPASLIYALCDLLVSELARCKAQNSRLRIRFLVSECLRIGVIVNAAIAGAIFLLAPALGEYIYHSCDAGRYLRCFAPLIVMLYCDALVDGMLKGLGEQVAGVRYNTLTAALDVLLLFFLLPTFHLGGYYFSFVLTHAVNFALSLRRLCVVADYPPQWPHALKAMLAAVLSVYITMRCAPACAALPSMLGSVLVYLSVYALLSLLLGTFQLSNLNAYMPKKAPVR
ncbi:MAG: oligosaccharide flippase family protein [Oscillospiraceae bacterium]|nr:oligosaccharide flippase family protein [Oscillospiraceae bacterium]